MGQGKEGMQISHAIIQYSTHMKKSTLQIGYQPINRRISIARNLSFFIERENSVRAYYHSAGKVEWLVDRLKISCLDIEQMAHDSLLQITAESSIEDKDFFESLFLKAKRYLQETEQILVELGHPWNRDDRLELRMFYRIVDRKLDEDPRYPSLYNNDDQLLSPLAVEIKKKHGYEYKV